MADTNPTTGLMKSPPEMGYWCIMHWQNPPNVMDLRGLFSSAELRWLADRLDEHNEKLKAVDHG